jgi:serine/threonine-protein kinase
MPDTQEQRIAARVGHVLADRWRLDRVLGAGGFAAVYAAEHIRSQRRAAIKVLHAEVAFSRADLARFVLEARAVNAIVHPGVVQVVDDGETADGVPFFVMDLLEGETVEARRKRAGGQIDAALTLSIADRVLDVLAAAHDKNIVHRDVKPENLFLTSREELKLLDFGIARCRELSTASRETQVGNPIGTLPFMAPEHAAGDWPNVDPRTDLWSVGATMFTLLSGQ